jgi:hypothetical protein
MMTTRVEEGGAALRRKLAASLIEINAALARGAYRDEDTQRAHSIEPS